MFPVVRFVNGEVSIDVLKWGLAPPYSREPQVDYATFNAMAETVTIKPAYRHAWRERQRCLVPVEAFFEWKGERAPKQKYRISVKGEPQFCVAGLREKWQQGANVLETFIIITTVANELVAEIHAKKRMPGRNWSMSCWRMFAKRWSCNRESAGGVISLAKRSLG